MGDRTSVEIEVKQIDFEWLLRAGFGDDEERLREAVDADEIGSDSRVVCFTQYEANYGNWDELEILLGQHFIEFDKSWGSGGGYNAGRSYCRNVSGEMRLLEVYDTEEQIIDFLRGVKDLEPDEIKMRVVEEYHRLMPFEIRELAA